MMGKVTEVGTNFSTGPSVGEAMPMPLRVTKWGLPAALSAKERVAWRAPAATGVNVSVTVQLALGAIAAPMQLPVGLLKSAGLLPPRIIEEIVRAALPELVTVTLSGELVAFCDSEGKFRVPGMKVMAGAGGGGAVPVPLSGTDCGLPLALSVMERLAAREPAAAGVKTMEMKQE